MIINPYAPPASSSSRITKQEAKMAFWNPSAAIKWSIFFGPAFGTILHMRNWQILGEHGKAAHSLKWVILSIVLTFFLPFGVKLFPESKTLLAFARYSTYFILLLWYFASAREQTKYVKDRFGGDYLRKKWRTPMTLSVALTGIFLVLTGVLVF
jgi:hypothetical protein